MEKALIIWQEIQSLYKIVANWDKALTHYQCYLLLLSLQALHLIKLKNLWDVTIQADNIIWVFEIVKFLSYQQLSLSLG